MCGRANRALVLAALLAVAGCMTPRMGEKVDQAFGLTPRPLDERDARPRTVFDKDAGLPAQIWYGDLAARIYHERRTNTYVAFDTVHRGWGAIPEAEAFARGFRPARARLQTAPPEDVKKVIDYLVSMEPSWRGS